MLYEYEMTLPSSCPISNYH